MRARLPLILLPLLGGALVLLLLFDAVDLGALFGESSTEEGYEAEDDASFEYAAEETVADGPSLAGRATAASLAAQAARDAKRLAAAADAGPDGGGPAGPGVVFKGRVLDPQGRPASSVKIEATALGGKTFHFATNTEGAFDDALPPGRYQLVLKAEGVGYRMLSRVLIDGSSADELEYTLSEPATFSLKVAYGEDAVAGVRVKLIPRGFKAEASFEATTDYDGVARFEDLPRARYRLEADVPDGPRFLRDENIWGDRERVIQIPGSAKLRGIVRDGKSGPGIPGAAVTLRMRPRGGSTDFETTFTSGPDGRFEVNVVKGYARSLLVEATGYAPYPNRARRTEWRAASRTLGLLVKRSEVELIIPMRSGASVRGLVSDSDGSPLPGILLTLKPRRGAAVQATTDSAGRYAAPNLNADRYQVLIETPEWFAEKPLSFLIRGADAEPVEYDITLKGARRFEGIVVTRSGKPVYGARVWVIGGGRPVNSARQAGRALEAFSDTSGRWTLSDIPAEITVAVRASHGDDHALPEWVPHSKPVPTRIRLQLQATGGVTGQVYDLQTRKPITGVRVQVRPVGAPRGRSGPRVGVNREGRFTVARLIPGTYTLLPTKEGYLVGAPIEVEVRAGDEPQTKDLALDPGLAFEGVVMDTNRKVVRGARVEVWGMADGKNVRRRSVSTDARGAFRLTGYTRGTYTLRARRGGYQVQQLQRLQGGEARLEVLLRKR